MSHWWEILPSFAPLLQTLAWIAFFAAILVSFRARVRQIALALEQRILGGSALKIGPAGIEVGALERLPEVEPGGPPAAPEAHSDLTYLDALRTPAALRSLADWTEARQGVYDYSREVFLSHVATPSGETDPGTGKPVFNIYIFVTRHRAVGLDGIAGAEFFLGRWWGNRVFAQKPTGGLLGVKLRAYGSILCVSRVTFDDGACVFLSRYIDVESRPPA